MSIANPSPAIESPFAVTPDVSAAVQATNSRFVRAIADADARAVAAVYADGATLLAPDTEPLHGRESIRAYWAAGLASGITGVALFTIRLEAIRDGAIEEGSFVLDLGAGADRTHLRGKYLVIHRRQPDGTWAWETDIFNANGAPE